MTRSPKSTVAGRERIDKDIQA